MFEVIWQIIEICNSCLEFWLIYFYLNKMLTLRNNAGTGIIVWYLGSVTVLSAVNALFPSPAISLAVTLGSMLTFSLLFCRDPLLRRIFINGIFLVLMLASECILLLFLRSFLHMEKEALNDPGVSRLIGIIGTKLLMFWLIMLIAKFSEKKYTEIKRGHWVMMILTPLISIFILMLISQPSYSSPESNSVALTAFFATAGLLYLNYATFSHIESYAKELRLDVLEEVIGREEKNYRLLGNAYNEMRALRHDFRNQISVAYDLIKHGETEAAERYLDSLSGKISRYSYTGNLFIDSMLNMKQRYAEQRQIAFQTKVSLSRRTGLDPVELCRILGNALDNAIEECERMEGSRFVEVSLSHTDEKLIIIITNSCSPDHDEKFRSRKTDKKHHGIGLISIQKSVERLGGLLQYGFQGDVFTMTIVLREPPRKGADPQ